MIVVSFHSRYSKLNAAQKEAVDSIDGPVMVVAGPGTGKTELLSMRAANILRTTDTLPENILCLTFTESGVSAMRQRLIEIIGADAYKIAIHTFHSFGSEVINQNSEYFYRGAQFQPADKLSSYEILRSIFENLKHNNPLAGQMNDEYTFLDDAMKSISDLKRSGLTDDELRLTLDANDIAIDKIERELSSIFKLRIGEKTISQLESAAKTIAEIEEPKLPADVAPYSNVLAISLAHAIDRSRTENSTTPITAWKKQWIEKDAAGENVLKAKKRQEKLRALSFIYYQYLIKMQEAKLYDFDDMILQVVHAMEVFPELRYNLQERYQYIMVDEYQDTNLAQARILHNLTDSEINGDRPNILVVGDDDQAIYSFQGADVSNVLFFREHYPACKLINLVENYRSVGTILSSAREVISQGKERLENYHPDLKKELHAQTSGSRSSVTTHEAASQHEEYYWIASDIKHQLKSTEQPSSIAVLAKRHKELAALLPYFADQNISVSYEHQENALDSEPVKLLEHLAQIIMAIRTNKQDELNGLLPELLAHPAFDFKPSDIWKLSLKAYNERAKWLEIMIETPIFADLAEWLLKIASASSLEPLELILDTLIGKRSFEGVTFASPFYAYFFEHPEAPRTFISYIEALRVVRSKVREHQPDKTPDLVSFLDCMEKYRKLNLTIQASIPASDQPETSVQLMTVHASKGLEFDHVYITGAIESAWGQNVKGHNRKISYPENLPLMSAGSSSDERLRLFFVAMTRAKKQLNISYAVSDSAGKTLEKANFLIENSAESRFIEASGKQQIRQIELDWYGPLVNATETDLHTTLQPVLERYAVSATDLGAFLDLTRGGPNSFLLEHLLKFPQATSSNAAYGSAVHATLQQAHNHLSATGKLRPVEDVLSDFRQNLEGFHMPEIEFEKYYQRGTENLQSFIEHMYPSFTSTQKAEQNFAHEGSMLDDVRLKGKLDLIDIDKNAKTIIVTDYKTGKPSRTWSGSSVHEKVKLHKYKQQLMFYKILIENSRTYNGYTVTSGVLQFVEPASNDDIISLTLEFNDDELSEFKKLVSAVWQHIIKLDMPDTSKYSDGYKGIIEFEKNLVA